ncbi:hypothetical protein [Pontibacter harenae]|uniref:hypothetical protein n=1 Tax=Pontibacter harenae TaxID=2894083 RepID=UPI001E594D61|nr:hypothetical protein [Pontibacter harenae]MCC9166802.1 hypothetical protein [Pontibacter harenae]
MKKLHIRSTFFLLLLAIVSTACSTKNDLEAFKEAEYKLAGIDEISLNGINLLDKKPSQFSFGDAATLYTAVAENKLTAQSRLGLNVELPEGEADRTMKVNRLKWQLLVDGVHTLSGVVDEPVELHHGFNNLAVKTPVLFEQNNGKTDLSQVMRLVAVLLEKDKSKRPDVKLQIKPTIQTSVGPFEMPAFISVTK